MKNLIKILFVLSFLLPVCVQGQAVTWQRYYSYPHNSISDVIQTFDGGYLLAGSISVPPKVNILLIKLNYLGIVEWDNIIYDSVQNISALSIKQTSDSGYVMTGQRGSDYYILKTDKSGNYLWRKSYNEGGDAEANEIFITNDGGFMLSGDIFYLSPGSTKSYLVKTDSNGNLQWEKLYGDSTFTSGTFVLQITDNDYYLTNTTKRNFSSPNIGMCYKLKNNGDIIWKSKIGVNTGGVPTLFRENYGLYICGESYTPYKLQITKFDTLGNILWQNKYDSTIALQNICFNYNFDFVFGGYESNNNQYDYAAIKIDFNGNFVYKKIIATPESSDDFCSKVKFTRDGGYIFVGNTNFGRDAGVGDNILVVKTDSGFNTSPIVNVNSNQIITPGNFILYQNFPNPFNPTTLISYTLTKDSFVEIIVYDLTGKEIVVLVNENNKAGNYKINFDGSHLASGVYFYSSFLNGIFNSSGKMLLTK